MGYRPTGRPAGRTSGPVTPDGKLTRARKILPHVRAFGEMARAVNRVMRIPNEVVVRDWTADARDVDVIHRYTPQERGEILSFVWWVYMNRSSWSREKLTASVQSVSPLMMFSSTFLAEVTGMPQSTVNYHMLKPPGISVSRVLGSCDPWVIHQLLEMSTKGEDDFRNFVRDLSLMRGVPKGFLSRISGVPVSGILRPERGVQFFPEKADMESGEVCSLETRTKYWKYHPGEKKTYDPRPGDQRSVRDSIAGTELGKLRATSSPVPSSGHIPYHLCIPGLASVRSGKGTILERAQRVNEWEYTYHLSSSTNLGFEATS